MKRSLVSPWLLSLGMALSACQFQACPQSCSSNGSASIPATPKVKPEPLTLPEPEPAQESLGVVWFDQGEQLIDSLETLSKGPQHQAQAVQEIKDALTQVSGSPELAKSLDLTRSMGCVVFDAMALIGPGNLPVSCVFHVRGGLDALHKALAAKGARKDGDRVVVDMLGKSFEFRPWGTKDAVWLSGGDKYSKLAKPHLERRLDQGQGNPKAELSVFVASAMDRYGLLAKPAIKSAVAGSAAYSPLMAIAANQSANAAIEELEAMLQLRAQVELGPEDLRLSLSENLQPSSSQLISLAKLSKVRPIKAHLLGILPKSSQFAVGVDFNFDEVAAADWLDMYHKPLSEAFRQETGEDIGTPKETRKFFEDIHKLTSGAFVAAAVVDDKKEAGFVVLYDLNKEDTAREFWRDQIKALHERFGKKTEFNPKPEEIEIDGLKVDRYQGASGSDSGARVDVGELDEVGFVVFHDLRRDFDTQKVVKALRGQDRVASLEGFEQLGAAFAGNHLAVAFNPTQMGQRDDERQTRKGQLGDVTGIMHVVSDKGVAMQLRIKREVLAQLGGLQDKLVP